MLCRTCGHEKPRRAFSPQLASNGRRYYRLDCRVCANAVVVARRKDDREAACAYSRQWHKKTQGYYRAKSCARGRGATQFCSKQEWVELRKGAACAWCECRLHPSFTHVDHVVPLCEGGQHTRDNLVLSCANCNLRREWERKVKKYA